MDETLARVKRAHKRLVTARRERDVAVYEAALDGRTIRAIAGASGMQTRQVHSIVVRMEAERNPDLA